jgi:PAS domain S-box-containing protein
MTIKPNDYSTLRSKAEAKLAASENQPKRALDPLRLVHELQVHQIELEIQNEELVAANHALESLRAKYQALFESAPIGYLTMSVGGEIRDANPRAADMLGRTQETLTSMSLRECFESASLASFEAFFAAVVQTDDVIVADNLLLHRPGTIPMYVRAQGRSQSLAADSERVVLLVLMDVSALKFAMEDVLSAIQMLPGVSLK